MNFKHLIPLRLLGKELNHLASLAMRNCEVPLPVVFDDLLSIQSFLATIGGRIQPIPFSSFEFHISKLGQDGELKAKANDLCHDFINLCGELVQSYTLHVDQKSWDHACIGTLLQNTPNLKKLKIITNDPGKDLLSSCPRLPKLQSLSILPKFERNGTLQLELVMLNQWFQKIPNLLKFDSGFLISIDASNPTSPEMLLSGMRNLSFVSLHVGAMQVASVGPFFQELINRNIKIHHLRVSANGLRGNDHSVFAEWINTASSTLEKLSITRDFNPTSVDLPGCQTLEVDCTQIGDTDGFTGKRISPDHFTGLKTVRISNYPSNRYFKIFERQPFPSVDNLYITDSPSLYLENSYFHKIFPNLKLLSVNGSAGGRDLEQIIKSFPNLVHLKLIDLVRETYSDWFGIITGGVQERDAVLATQKSFDIQTKSSPTQFSLTRMSRKLFESSGHVRT